MRSPNNPLEHYIHTRIAHFGEEAKRLGTKEPLDRFKAIIDAFLEIQRTLGGLEHEVALHTLKGEFKLVRDDIREGVKRAWANFWRYRALASQHARLEREQRKAAALHLKELGDSIEQLKSVDAEMAATSQEIFNEFKELDKLELTFSGPWRMMSWTGLWVDSKLLAIYIQYLFARMRVFVQFHGFIFLTPIFILGIGYSLASKAAIEAAVSLVGPSFWFGGGLLIAAYAFKKYVIDKKLKAIQKRLEERLFRPLSTRLMLARTTALGSRTLQEGRQPQRDSGAA